VTGAWSDDPDALRCVFSGLPWRGRVRDQAKLLLRRSPFFVFAAVAPGILVWATGIDDTGRLTRFEMAIATAIVALTVVCSLLAAAVSRAPPRTLTFDAQTIVEETSGKTIERTWKWVLSARDDGQELELRVRPEPLRSFRLARTEATLLRIDRTHAGEGVYLRMQRFLRAQQLL
jgi:hypothetical protein